MYIARKLSQSNYGILNSSGVLTTGSAYGLPIFVGTAS